MAQDDAIKAKFGTDDSYPIGRNARIMVADKPAPVMDGGQWPDRPSDLIRQTLAEKVKEKTGRDLVVAGPASFSFWPGLGVSLKDVTLSGPPGSQNKLVSMAALDVNIKTMPLLQRQIEVRRLVLKKPVFDFRVDKQGTKNWQLADADLPVRRRNTRSSRPERLG